MARINIWILIVLVCEVLYLCYDCDSFSELIALAKSVVSGYSL